MVREMGTGPMGMAMGASTQVTAAIRAVIARAYVLFFCPAAPEVI